MNEIATDAPDVVLLHSNDIHSRLEQAARMAAYIEEIRRSHGADHVLTLDIGDHMDRMRVETEASDGLANIALLNAAGYDAATIGNNEGLTFTQEQLDEAYGVHAQFPLVCANFFLSETMQRPAWMLPSIVIIKAGLRFGLIGVSAAFKEFYKLLGWEASDPLPEVEKQVQQLRADVDVLIIMSHLGLPLDRRMAQEIAGIDLILGGHTHHLLEEPEVIGSTYLCAAGKFGEYMGRVDIWFDAKTKRPRFNAVCLPMEARAGLEQPEATAIIGSFKTEGERRLSRVVATLESPLALMPDRESPLGNLLAAGLRSWTNAEIGIVNAGQLLHSLAAGEVTAGDLHALCPSPINPCRMKLTGRMIRLSLEEALLPEYIDKQIRGFGFRGLVLGTLAVDGLTVEYVPDNPDMGKIMSILVNGEPLRDDQLYVVGTIDMFTFGVGYEKIKNGLDIDFYLPEFIRGVLEHELQDQEAIADSHRMRWLAI